MRSPLGQSLADKFRKTKAKGHTRSLRHSYQLTYEAEHR